MKTLLLSSNGSYVIKEGLKLLFKDVSEIKLAYITTAGKGSRDKRYLKWHKKLLKKGSSRKGGFSFTELDIEGKKEKEVRELLKGKNVVYVEGGNTFYLLRAVRQSGFGKVIKELINRGVVYCGSSAGSYLACPTIEVAIWKEPGEEKDQFGVTKLAAMNLVPFLIKAHYEPAQRKLLKEKLAKVKWPVKILKDGQAILVKGNKVKLVGRGKEIKI